MMSWISAATLALGMTVPLSGTVVDEAGKPVADAGVWLGDTLWNHEGPEAQASGTTDAEGKFQFERPAELVGRGGMWSPTLWAYKAGSRVAFREFKQKLPAADEPVRLTLGPPASMALRVLQPDGKPAANAKVRVAEVKLKAPRPPDKLLDLLAGTTDADGKVTIDGLATEDVMGIDVTVEGQVVQCLPIGDDGHTVAIRPTGRLKARVVADDPKAVKGWTITAWLHPIEPDYKGTHYTHWVRETTGDDGRVSFPPVAQGQVVWEIKPPEGTPYLVESQSPVMIRPGEEQDAEIRIAKGIPVEGIVREEPGGKPIPGIKVDVSRIRPSGYRHDPALTDDKGRFSAAVLPGTIRFSFDYSIPKEYFLPPGVQHWVDFEVKADEKPNPLEVPALHRSALVRGKVVDEAGKPVAMAIVEGYWSAPEFGTNRSQIIAHADEKGEFMLGNVAPKAQVEVKALAEPTGTSETVTVASAGEGESITIHTKKKPTLALSGRVVDADGKPLAGALIHVNYRAVRQSQQYLGTYDFDDTVRTGEDGTYRTPATLPIGQTWFRVEARASGCVAAESGWIEPPDHEAPTLSLRRLIVIGSRDVTGRVLDSSGKPVSGAQVFQAGDGPKIALGTTDDDGKYQVLGVLNAPSLLFVKKDGYHFLGRRVEPDERSVEFTLRRLDEPAAKPLRPAASPVTREQERAIVEKLVADARKVPVGVNEMQDTQQLPRIIAMSDPDRAIEMIQNQVVPANENLLTALAIGLSENRPDEALEAAVSPSVGMNVFDRLGATAPRAFRLKLLDRAAEGFRARPEPGGAGAGRREAVRPGGRGGGDEACPRVADPDGQTSEDEVPRPSSRPRAGARPHRPGRGDEAAGGGGSAEESGRAGTG